MVFDTFGFFLADDLQTFKKKNIFDKKCMKFFFVNFFLFCLKIVSKRMLKKILPSALFEGGRSADR